MKHSIALIGFILTLAFPPSHEPIEGVWHTGQDNTRIEIIQDQGEWLGKIRSSDNDLVRIGKIVLKDLEKHADVWTGKIFSPKRDRWFEVEITPTETKLHLLVSAGFSQKQVEWTRSSN
ncbi:hypothetical protein [Cyclobacterium xiamenense]|uniref:hypothetical protein n=1 Tax=Cyclobacterium xiamenense TaxID=1297121 RepID=UPI0035CFD2B5